MENTFESLSGKEYLLTNGIGGYCSSTVIGANTRRYHGLLVASFNPPTDRKVLVSKSEEKIIVDKRDMSYLQTNTRDHLSNLISVPGRL